MGGTGGGRGVTKPVSEGTSSQYEKVKINHKKIAAGTKSRRGLPNNANKPQEKKSYGSGLTDTELCGFGPQNCTIQNPHVEFLY